MLKTNESNLLSKDALREHGCPCLINYTTQGNIHDERERERERRD
jgi:hypothetical protein